MDGPSFLEDPAFLSPHSMGRYLETLRRKGCAEATIQSYRRNLDFFYHALPEDKRIGPGALEGWKQQMIEKGYTAGTINHRLTTVNGYLGFVGLRNYQVSYLSRENREEPAPELSRQEYLRLLSAAKALGRQRTYLLIKTIAVIGLAIHELPCLTVEAVEEGAARVPQGSSRRVVPIPRCLQRELLAYSGKKELAAGPVLCYEERQADQPQPRLHGDTGPGQRGRGAAGEVQPPVPSEAIPGDPAATHPAYRPYGGAGPRTAAGGRAAENRLGQPLTTTLRVTVINQQEGSL